MGARFYDPSTAAFMSEDSFPGSSPDPTTLNRYAYALDDPLGCIDPSGHVSWATVGLVAAAVVLSVTAVLQGGLDVPEDTLDAGVISDAIASITAVAGGPASVA